MYSASRVRSAFTMPKSVRNRSASSRLGDCSRAYARSVTLTIDIVHPQRSRQPYGLEPVGSRPRAVQLARRNGRIAASNGGLVLMLRMILRGAPALMLALALCAPAAAQLANKDAPIIAG